MMGEQGMDPRAMMLAMARQGQGDQTQELMKRMMARQGMQPMNSQMMNGQMMGNQNEMARKLMMMRQGGMR